VFSVFKVYQIFTVHIVNYIQSGSMNCGLLFAGPLPLGGCEWKDKQNTVGSHVSDTLHMRAPVGGRQL
jgi:hypothetical protein